MLRGEAYAAGVRLSLYIVDMDSAHLCQHDFAIKSHVAPSTSRLGFVGYRERYSDTQIWLQKSM
eukprot:scaffold10894_cov97-Skeletonema_dohrnii-CCMP3373.AAC.2